MCLIELAALVFLIIVFFWVGGYLLTILGVILVAIVTGVVTVIVAIGEAFGTWKKRTR